MLGYSEPLCNCSMFLALLCRKILHVASLECLFKFLLVQVLVPMFVSLLVTMLTSLHVPMLGSALLVLLVPMSISLLIQLHCSSQCSWNCSFQQLARLSARPSFYWFKLTPAKSKVSKGPLSLSLNHSQIGQNWSHRFLLPPHYGRKWKKTQTK